MGCPLWDRRLSSPPDREPSHRDEKALHASLKRLGVARVVVGHTVQSTINSACGGAVWRCDTGMSRWVRTGPVEALEITPSGVRVLRESARCSRLKEKKERKKEEKGTRTRIRVKSWTQMMLLSAQKRSGGDIVRHVSLGGARPRARSARGNLLRPRRCRRWVAEHVRCLGRKQGGA